MIKLGEINRLKIEHKTSIDYVFVDEAGTEVIVPFANNSDEWPIGESLAVFVYKDANGQWIGSLAKPKIELGKFAWLEAKDVNEVGAFMDWGMPKDLLVPFRHQRQKMMIGKSYLVYLLIDVLTDRLIATAKINNLLNNDDLSVEVGDEVDLLVYEKTDLGYNAIINHQYKGLIYANEVFKEIRPGDQLKGFIKVIRPDNKIDLSLQRHGFEASEPVRDLILEKLQAANGFLAVSDKSEPEQIYKLFGVSKKVFKKAVGGLYKDKLISIEEEGLRLL